MPTTVYPATSVEHLLARFGPEVAVVRDGPRTIIGLDPSGVVVADGPGVFSALNALDGGWWAGFLSYDLGRAVERVPDLAESSHEVPDAAFLRFDTRVTVHADGTIGVDGEAASFDRLMAREPCARVHPALDDWTSSLDRDGYERAVERIHDYLVAGDCYQVNLTRQLRCERAADPAALFAALRAGNPAPHEALVRTGDVAVVSASPERFLRRDGRRVETRPIKGTSADPDALRNSEKDHAENVMIVDLARNDLGRVCEYGSIHVPALCELEAHPGLYHLVSTVTGELRPDTGIGDLIEATFPPASVTGCPKPRVLEIIEELEPVRRGVYCGAVGWIDADNDIVDLNVAIRTFTITEGKTFLGVGGGIVADSDADDEWRETELKVARLLAVASRMSDPLIRSAGGPGGAAPPVN